MNQKKRIKVLDFFPKSQGCLLNITDHAKFTKKREKEKEKTPQKSQKITTTTQPTIVHLPFCSAIRRHTAQIHRRKVK